MPTTTTVDLDCLAAALPDELGFEPRPGQLIVLGLDADSVLVASATLHVWNLLADADTLQQALVAPLAAEGALDAVVVAYASTGRQGAPVEGARRLARLLSATELPVIGMLLVDLDAQTSRELVVA